MLALCVDDEAPLLAELVRAVSASPDIEETVQFRYPSQVVEWAKDNRPDIAFLDVQMRGCTGLELAARLREMYPSLPVIFCTGYREYAFDAFQLHAAGYLSKPVSAEAVQKEIDLLKEKEKIISEKPLKVQCFGNFEVFRNGKPLHFSRKRAKEVFAYLIDRRGASVTTKELSAALFEDESGDEKKIMQLYKLLGDLRAVLEKEGIENVMVRSGNDYSINVEMIDCDYYRYLAGDKKARQEFTGEYMIQYPWAEETAGLLYGEEND